MPPLPGQPLVEAPQEAEEVDGRLGEVAAPRQVEDRGTLPRQGPAEVEPDLAGPQVPRLEPHGRARCVMRQQHAGRDRGAARRRVREAAAQHGLHRRARDATGPQQGRDAEAGHDGGFDPDLRRPAIQHGVDPTIEVLEHMGRRRRADAPRAIGRGRRDRNAGRRDQRKGDRVGRHAQRDAVEARAGEVRHRAAPRRWHHQRQRAGPEGAGQGQGVAIEAPLLRRGREVRHMGDERVEAGPALGGVDARHGLGGARIGAEPVDGLGREGDEAPRAQQGGSGGDPGGIGGEAGCRSFVLRHGATIAASPGNAKAARPSRNARPRILAET